MKWLLRLFKPAPKPLRVSKAPDPRCVVGFKRYYVANWTAAVGRAFG